jgi:tetratricopeptide (TPR) repeat protein
MAKQQPKKFQQSKKQSSASLSRFYASPIPTAEAISPLKTFTQQSVFIILIGCIIYFNSIYEPITHQFSKYALDDDIVMRLNDYVQQGFSGIGKIMTTDSYDSFFKSMGSAGELSGGRYRPLSIVTFAIEQQIFGKCYGNRFIEVKDSLATLSKNPAVNPGPINKLIVEKAQIESQISRSHEDIATIRHIVSVLLYILSVVFLLKLLRDYIFKYANLKWIHPNDIAFITALIFLVHPIHTEVVANVKSRDEILSFLFIVLTFIFVFKHDEFQNGQRKNPKAIYLGLLFYFLALLSKEWGITLVALIPMALFIFKKHSFWKSIKYSMPYFAVAVFYLILRYKFVGMGRQGEITEVLNNPYVYATPIQKLATEIFVLIKYLWLLIFPHPLSADYSWKTIPYRNFGDIMVWVSLFVHLAIIYYLFVFLIKRNWLAFAIAFYVFHLFLVSNLAMPIGATMGERLIYHSSLGFAMFVAFLLLSLIQKIKFEIENKKRIFLLLIILLVVPMGYKTISRNPDWKTDNDLFVHDANVVTNSVLANGNAGKAYIEWGQKDTTKRQAYLDSAIRHLKKAVMLHPKYVNGYLNLGLAYFQKKNLDTAEYYWNQGRKYFPTHPFFRQSYDPALSSALVERAKEEGKKGNVPLAIQYISRALRYDSTNADTWYHYGGANFSVGNINEAYRGWTKCLQLNPNHSEAKKGMEVLMQRMNQQQVGK